MQPKSVAIRAAPPNPLARQIRAMKKGEARLFTGFPPESVRVTASRIAREEDRGFVTKRVANGVQVWCTE